MWCASGYGTCLRKTNAGEAATARTMSVNDCVLLRCTAFATPAAAHPRWFLAGTGSSTVESVIPYWSIVFAMQFMNTVLFFSSSASSRALCTVAPPTSAGNVVVPSTGLLTSSVVRNRPTTSYQSSTRP